MSKEVYTPLPEANTERVRSTLVLPFKLEEQIGLNTGKIELLAQIGGISHLKIQNDEHGRTSQVVPQIVGVDGQGTAVSGAASVERIPVYSNDHERSGLLSRYKTERWTGVTIRINSEEIKSKLLKADQIVNKSDPWAKEINSAVKKSIVDSGVRHLMSLEGHEKILATFVYSIDILLASSTVWAGTPEEFLPNLLYQAMITGVLWNFVKPVLGNGPERWGEGSRVSLSMGPEIDRVVVLCIASLGKPVVKTLEKSKG